MTRLTDLIYFQSLWDPWTAFQRTVRAANRKEYRSGRIFSSAALRLLVVWVWLPILERSDLITLFDLARFLHARMRTEIQESKLTMDANHKYIRSIHKAHANQVSMSNMSKKRHTLLHSTLDNFGITLLLPTGAVILFY